MGVEVRDLRKSFGSSKVVDDVSFAIQKGELAALLGPSGGGKSTVLRILAGLELPDAGDVFLNGACATRTRAEERNIGFVFQGYALFKHMTVRQNVGFGLSVRGRPRSEIERTVDSLLARVKLDGLAERFPAELSGGQRQRVALARAIAIEPTLLLMDEPFGALDAKVRVELRSWIRAIHDERGMTSVIVTHDQEEAMDLADRVIILNHGKVEQIGTPEEIYDHPATEFVASFIGSTNVLRGEVKEGRSALGALDAHAPEGASEGTSVRAFVRPHDVEIRAAPDSGDGEVATAHVRRMSRVGFVVKIELELADGQPLTVELTKDRVAELGIIDGDRVFVNLREAKIFVQDYAI